MSDRVLFSLMGLFAVAMVGLALVWPQGVGARSPGPFGHMPVQQTAAAKAARAHAAAGPPVLTLAPSGGPSQPRSNP